MKSLSLSLVMDQNVLVIPANQTLQTALEKASTHHLIIVTESQVIGVLTTEQAALISPSSQLLHNLQWIPPLIIDPEMDTIAFCQEHLHDLRPIIVRSTSGEILGIVTPTLLIESLFNSWKIINTFFDTLLDTVNEAIAVVTQDGVVSHWNSKAQAMYSIADQSIIGKPISNFFERTALATLSILDEGRPIRQAYHRPRPETHVQINASPVILAGEIIGAISAEQDITQVVRLNEELSNASSLLLDLKQKTDPAKDPFTRIIGKSHPIQRTISIARKVAGSEATILITGESGVGKELFAQAIHKDSPRATKPFIAVNCGAIPIALFESELFGYKGGAFTGAERKGKPGKMELAHGGTLFLDEIGELPIQLQVKLLRVLQDKCFYRVGGTEPITVDTRIIAATNRDLDKMIKSGDFREDLYYRLNVIALEIPPLRQRTEDIPDLLQSFLKEFTIKYKKPIPILDPEIMINFLKYDWPGNIRELRNVIERLAILAEGKMLNSQYLPPQLSSLNYDLPSPVTSLASQIIHRNLHHEDSGEMKRIVITLEKTNGNKTAAARLLGISRGTLYYKLKQYGLV
ncbi:sigma-54-dependent Fis family transcriptional regulator [Desulfosporosinus meridiei]|uniref:Transcriptional regulator n=1 Tax=Desulfosporosinus meridiei (strain ATCC BAA-275 / DSM 13257 / KCTC 12902 / NCIMB 13706 / S10) TaxID=768704 RepID=J7ISX5_DESMD|nr:sigma-54-dependent Fis family transcriptional regulator [Desulfosporosinus meridiei]AFQ44982.1 transcriptional regulator [Desulfosporosinus meridiei DSM 13257]